VPLREYAAGFQRAERRKTFVRKAKAISGAKFALFAVILKAEREGKETGMKPSNQQSKPPAAESGRSEVEAPSRPGGCHSRGVPGEEGEVRKRMRVLKVGDRSQRIYNSRPLTGATGAEQASAARLEKGVREAKLAGGARLAAGGDTEAAAVFVIAKKCMDFLGTPVFHAGESGEEEAVALFTNRQQAEQYLVHAGWSETDEIGELSPSDLLRWLVEAEQDGVRYVAVNANRDRHLAGDPQPVLSLDDLGEESADRLFREVMELVRDGETLTHTNGGKEKCKSRSIPTITLQAARN